MVVYQNQNYCQQQ